MDLNRINKIVFLFFMLCALGFIVSCTNSNSGDIKCKTDFDCAELENPQRFVEAYCSDKVCKTKVIPNKCGNGKCEESASEDFCTCPKDCDKETCSGIYTYELNRKKVESEYVVKQCVEDKCAFAFDNSLSKDKTLFDDKISDRDLQIDFTITYKNPFDIHNDAFEFGAFLKYYDSNKVRLPISIKTIKILKDKTNLISTRNYPSFRLLQTDNEVKVNNLNVDSLIMEYAEQKMDGFSFLIDYEYYPLKEDNYIVSLTDPKFDINGIRFDLFVNHTQPLDIDKDKINLLLKLRDIDSTKAKGPIRIFQVSAIDGSGEIFARKDTNLLFEEIDDEFSISLEPSISISTVEEDKKFSIRFDFEYIPLKKERVDNDYVYVEQDVTRDKYIYNPGKTITFLNSGLKQQTNSLITKSHEIRIPDEITFIDTKLVK
jgi:hypothetical protein